MTKLYDRTYGVTEDELLNAAKENSWTVGDVLSAYTGQVKLFRVIEELSDNGDLDTWSIDCRCTPKELEHTLINEYDNIANLHVYGHLRGTEVRCTITLSDGTMLYMFMPVKESYDSTLESRVRRLERLLGNNY